MYIYIYIYIYIYLYTYIYISKPAAVFLLELPEVSIESLVESYVSKRYLGVLSVTLCL